MVNIPILKDYFYTLKGIFVYNIFLKKSCYLNHADIQNYQYRKLKILLIDSFENVTYYNELFNSIGFNPKYDFNQIGDISKIPLLSKDLFRKRRFEFTNEKYKSISLPFKTSGSSGNPMEVLVHPRQWIIEQGVVWRHWKWGGYNFRDSLAMVRSFVPKNSKKLWKHNPISNFTYYSPFHLNDENINIYLKHMIESRIKILRGYPSSILFLAQYILLKKCEVPKLKMILTASEVLTDDDRYTIEKAFNVKIFNHYGLAEQIVMMGDCEKHEGLHNYDEYGYLELLDTDNPGIKKIVGTNLHNLTTPLIRYDTGDYALVSEKPCSCGRSSIIIKNVIGRHDSYINTEEGFKIPTVNFYTMFEEFLEIQKWQIVQHSLNKLEFIIKCENNSFSRSEYLLSQIFRRINSKFTVDLSINKDFIRKGEGKINSFVSLINE